LLSPHGASDTLDTCRDGEKAALEQELSDRQAEVVAHKKGQEAVLDAADESQKACARLAAGMLSLYGFRVYGINIRNGIHDPSQLAVARVGVIEL